MAQKSLRDVLAPRPADSGELRWQAAVPLGTNLFLLLELFQFALAGSALVLLVLCTGVWFTEGGIAVEDIVTSLSISGKILLAIVAGFIGISVLFFGNRYYAVYHMDHDGIYHEGTRGSDGRNEWLCLRFRPFPVVGTIRAARTRSRYLTWDKVDRFQDIRSMRVILLRRGFWHMLRLHTPDAETHDTVVRFLEQFLRRL